MQKHFLISERIHGELALEHEATKLKSRFTTKIQSKTTKETRCLPQLSRHDSCAPMWMISPRAAIVLSLLAFSD